MATRSQGPPDQIAQLLVVVDDQDTICGRSWRERRWVHNRGARAAWQPNCERGAENDPRFCLELFRRALDGRDSEAWRGLVELYQPMLLARLQQRGVAPDLAEEALQEALVALWQRSECGRFSTGQYTLAQVLNYLWGSVRFALIKLRRQQREISFGTSRRCSCTSIPAAPLFPQTVKLG
jgi:hypothetical protein